MRLKEMIGRQLAVKVASLLLDFAPEFASTLDIAGVVQICRDVRSCGRVGRESGHEVEEG